MRNAELNLFILHFEWGEISANTRVYVVEQSAEYVCKVEAAPGRSLSRTNYNQMNENLNRIWICEVRAISVPMSLSSIQTLDNNSNRAPMSISQPIHWINDKTSLTWITIYWHHSFCVSNSFWRMRSALNISQYISKGYPFNTKRKKCLRKQHDNSIVFKANNSSETGLAEYPICKVSLHTKHSLFRVNTWHTHANWKHLFAFVFHHSFLAPNQH